MSAIKFIQQVARMKAADFSKIGEGIVTMADKLNFEHIAGEIATTFQNAGLPLDKLDDFIKSKDDVIKYLNIIESSKPTFSKVSNDIIKKGSESAEVIDFKGFLGLKGIPCSSICILTTVSPKSGSLALPFLNTLSRACFTIPSISTPN